MQNQQPVIARDFSRATIRTVQSSIVAPNSVRLALNLDSDQEIGSLVTRLGTDIVGTQAVALAVCKGLHYFRDTVGSNHKLFGVFSDGVNNDVYDMLTGTKSLEDDNPGLKVRFLTYLDSCVRVNGVDAVKSWNGSAWVSSGGAFDEANMPLGSLVMEWRDRVYTAGVAAAPDILYYSTVADPDSRTISWTVTADDPDSAGSIAIEQEDGGGGITALAKVPGYLIVLKQRSMKRWDGVSTYPDDLINVGAPCQEAVCMGRGMAFILNEYGVYVTNGGYPERISKPVQDFIEAIPAANLTSVSSFCDEVYAYFSIGNVTVDGNSYTNVVLRYSIDSRTWDVFSYYNAFNVFAWYLDSNAKVIIAGDSDGQVLKINTGYTDYASEPKPITYSLETHDIDFGDRSKIKTVNNFVALTENISNGQALYRSDSRLDSDWKLIRNITKPVEEINTYEAKGHWFNYKITGTTDSGRVKILGYMFPEKSINVAENVSD